MNVMARFQRQSVSILSTKLSKYVLIPRQLRYVSAGRTTRSPDSESMRMRLRREEPGEEMKWSESLGDRSWIIPDKRFANLLGEK